MESFLSCKKRGLIAECCMLQDTELLLTVKRACAIEKNCKAFFWVSSFPLQIFAVLCKNARTYSLLVSALHYQLCWSTSQIYSRFRQCITVKLNHQLSLGDTLIPHIWKEVSFLMIQGTNYWSPWASPWIICTPHTRSPSHSLVKQVRMRMRHYKGSQHLESNWNLTDYKLKG